MVELGAAWDRYIEQAFSAVAPVSALGRVRKVLGTLIEASVPNASIGEQCDVFHPQSTQPAVRCEVIGFTEESVLLSPLGAMEGISGSFVVRPLRCEHEVAVSPALLGRVLDGFGQPLDGRPAAVPHGGVHAQWRKVIAAAPIPTQRPRIVEPFATGVRSIDAALTLGCGQRVTALQTSAPLDAVAWSLAFREKADDGPLEKLLAGDASLSLSRWPVPFGYWEPQAKDLTRLSALFLQFSCSVRQASDIAQCTPNTVQAFLRACWRTNPDLVQEDPIPQLRGNHPPRPSMSSLQLFYLRVQCAREPLKSEQLPL